MKASLLLALLLLAGCQTTRPAINPLPDPTPLRAKPENYTAQPPPNVFPTGPISREPRADAEKFARQAQLIEALLAQNDALTMRARALENSQPSSAAGPSIIKPVSSSAAAMVNPTPFSPRPAAPAMASGPVTEMPLLVPNADGVIDVGALDGEGNVNPFAVRRSATEKTETTLAVQGIIAATKTCALVNEHVLEPGERIGAWQLSRFETDSLVLDGDDVRLKLPVNDRPIRVRH